MRTRLMLPLAALAAMLALPQPLRADPAADALRGALAAAARDDWSGAAATARGAGDTGASVIAWMRLRDAQGGARLGDYESFLARHPDWPGLPLLRQRGEEAVARSTDPARVIAWFAGAVPQTPTGALALIAALRAAGEDAAADAEARRAWVALTFTEAEEAAFLASVGQGVAGAHAARLDRLLWDRRTAEAARMLPRVDAATRALAAARLALQGGRPGVNALIAALPAAQADDPGLAHDRFHWRMDQGLFDGAAALIVERSSAGTLGDPAAWAPRRARLARELMEQGQARLAYQVAAGHGLTAGADFADLEFLSGFLALRRLDDPQAALAHFRRLATGVSTGISLSRALYWEGRALEAMDAMEAAEAAYRAAARHSSAYYGLLAAERLAAPLDAALLAQPAVADWRGAPVTQGTAFAAARLLFAAGDRGQAKRFLLHLAEGRPAAEIAQLAEAARALGDPHLGLVLAKQAAEQGLILPATYYPVPDMVPDGLPVSRALALAIARRESEFDPAVVSSAGARGLMQVMPGTAEDMARATGLPYARGRLTSDPAYNVTLGAAYLAQLVQEFGPAVALVAAGYNAGPGRPRRWIEAFGDPRRPDVDVVDWVESIPITETRTYVMRVAESLVIYRARLRGAAGPIRLTAELKGG